MGDATGIEWTERTWNPWHGCTKVSPGCDNCYMFREKKQYGQDPEMVVRSKTKFFDPLKWARAGVESALVFTCSWSDFFHKAGDEWRREAWEIIKATPQFTYQILTKRPSRIVRHLPADWGAGYPNVWLGTSAESHEWAERRIPLLLDIPAAVHFVSAEPLLDSINFQELCTAPGHTLDALSGRGTDDRGVYARRALKWVIVGGESGPGARPMDEEWARWIKDGCEATGVAFFLKQLGGHPDPRAKGLAVIDGERFTQMPA